MPRIRHDILQNISRALLKVAQSRIIKDSPTSILIDGNRGFGQVICTDAVQFVIEKVEKNMNIEAFSSKKRIQEESRYDY